MILKIHDKQRVSDLQQEFSETFPFLRLVFYRKAHGPEEASFNKFRYPENMKIGEILMKRGVDEIEITGRERTSDVEQAFEEQFGLHLQVFRRAGASWVQTVGTDNLTLEEQNILGQNASMETIHPDYIKTGHPPINDY